MCADSLARCAAGGVDALSLGGEHPGHRVLGQPVDLHARDELAQLARHRQVAVGMAQADGRRDVEHAPGVRRAAPDWLRRRRRAGYPGGLGGGGEELAQRQVDRHRLARLRLVPRSLDDDQLAAGDPRKGPAVGAREDVVPASMDDQHRTANPPRQSELALAVARGEQGTAGEGDRRLAIGLEPPADAVLDLLGRVWLGEVLRQPPLDEVLPVRPPVLRVELAEAPRGQGAAHQHRQHPGVPHHAPVQRADETHREVRIDEDRAEDALRVLRSEQHRPLRPAGEADDERPVDAVRVQDRERVPHELLLGVGRVGRWPIRLAVAAGVEGEHPRPAGEVRDLRLPAARVDD